MAIDNEEIMEDTECHHEWKVTTDENNFPEDVVCFKCKEVSILVCNDLDEINIEDK